MLLSSWLKDAEIISLVAWWLKRVCQPFGGKENAWVRRKGAGFPDRLIIE
jgi:hypothetical protein